MSLLVLGKCIFYIDGFIIKCIYLKYCVILII